MTAFAMTTLAVPQVVGLCAGCKEAIAIRGAYCLGCAELNEHFESARLAQLEAVANAERERSEHARAEYHAERLARMCAAMPRINGELPGELPGERHQWLVDAFEALTEMPRPIVFLGAALLLVGFWGLVGWAIAERFGK